MKFQGRLQQVTKGLPSICATPRHREFPEFVRSQTELPSSKLDDSHDDN